MDKASELTDPSDEVSGINSESTGGLMNKKTFIQKVALHVENLLPYSQAVQLPVHD